MLYANRIARGLAPEAWAEVQAVLDGGQPGPALLAAGFPRPLRPAAAADPAATCRRLTPGTLDTPYADRLHTAFDAYDRYAASCGDPGPAKRLSPVVAAAVLDRGGRYAAYPEERHLYATGNLPLPCPTCGKPTPAIGRWPGSACAEILEYSCCGSEFLYLRPFREWAFDKAVFAPASHTLYHHGHQYAREAFLTGAYAALQRNLAKALLFIRDNGPVREQEAVTDTVAVMLGRGEMNPGHVIFEDFAGIMLLDQALRDSGRRPRFRVVTPDSARWYEDLGAALPDECQWEVERVPHGLVEAMGWCLRTARPLVQVKVHPCWPHTLPGDPGIEALRRAIVSIPARRGVAVAKSGLHVLFPLRVHNRAWQPQADNVRAVMACIEARRNPVHFVLHGVGAEDPQYDPFRTLAAERSNVSLLFDPSLPEVLAEYAAADLVVGPIGSGFWWAGMHGAPCVTIHPKRNPATVELGDWILPPAPGRKPLFLSLLPGQQCICLEEDVEERATYGALTLPVAPALEAVRRMLHLEAA